MADSSDVVCEIPAKKPHLDSPGNKDTVSIHTDIKDLSQFSIVRILSCNSSRKSITIEGRFVGSPHTGIVILEKTAFDEQKLRDQDYLGSCSLKQYLHNDIYANYDCFPKAELNTVKATVIHPATQKHIKQYDGQVRHIINETPAIYKDVVEPYLATSTQFTLQWVYNILEHKAEQGKIVYEDDDAVNGFILLPDLKWDGKTVETLYLLAIPHRKGIKSLRDLTAQHLPLLRNIHQAGTRAICKQFGVSPTCLRIYFHYHPSFYHLHVHFTTLQYDTHGVFAEKSHLLANVISNLELVADYYQRVTLPFSIRENDDLFEQLESKGHVKKVEKSVSVATDAAEKKQNDSKTCSN